MVAFLIARLPSHPKSLDAVAYMQKNAFSYRISTSIPLMNFLMTSEGGDSRQLEVFEELEIKAEVDSTETPATNGNSAPMERIVKEEVGTSAVDEPDDHTPRLEISSVTTESVVPRENPSVDVGQAEEEEEDEHQEQPVNEMDSSLNQVENDDIIMNDNVHNVLLAQNHDFDESNAEMPMNITLAVIEEGVHDVPTKSVLEEVQQGAEEHEEPNFLGEKEGAGDEQRVERGEGHEMTVDELLEPLDAGDSTRAVRPLHNNDLLFDFEDTSRLNDELQVEKEIMEPEDDEEENMEVDRNVEEFEEEEELVEEQELEDDKMEEDAEDIEEQSDEGEGDMEEDELNSDEEEVSDDEEDASSDEKDEKVNKRKKKDDRAKGNSVGRHLFSCFVKNCSSSFKTFEELEEHVKIHSGKQDFVCDVCKKEFSSTAAAMGHLQERKKMECCACGKKSSHASSLIRHYRCHTGEKPYVCKTCGKGFAQDGSLKIHMVTHTGEKRFSCGYCEKRFALKMNLESHVRTHTGDKPFKCSHCGFKCNQASNLKVHNRTHTREKPYVCGHCKKRFSRRDILKYHEVTHTGEKPFECMDCGKRFTKKVRLNEHIRTHSGQKPYSCKKCDAKFTRSNSLKYHMEQMTTFLIARLPVHSKSLDAVEFMQKNDISYCLSTNLALLNFVMSSDGGSSQLRAKVDLSGEFQLGDEENHLVDVLTDEFQQEPQEILPIDSDAEEDDHHDERDESFLNLFIEEGEEIEHFDEEGSYHVVYPFDFAERDAAESMDPAAGVYQIRVKIEGQMDFDESMMNAQDVQYFGGHAEELNQEAGSEIMDLAMKQDDKSRKNPVHLFICPIEGCTNAFTSFEGLRAHVRMRSGTANLFCDVCGKNFSSIDKAMEHIRKRETRECCGCGIQYAPPLQLLRHYKIHNGKEYFDPTAYKKRAKKAPKRKAPENWEAAKKCEICDAGTEPCPHKKQKPFKCDQCGRPFAKPQQLKRHLLTHSGEKPFLCEHCGRKFTRKEHMNTHKKRFHARLEERAQRG